MPELPEVETIVRELCNCLLSKKISSIEEHYPGTVRYKSNHNEESISTLLNEPSAGFIESVCRRGKYIIIKITSGLTIIVHLRMTGKLIIKNKNQELNNEADTVKHVRATFRFSDGSSLLFNDPRTFGKIDVINTCEYPSLLCRLGCEPLTEELSFRYIAEIFSKKKIAVKKALLNQDIIAGIGNIYANEILYRSRIDPLRAVNTLTEAEIEMLIKEIKSVLKQAISCNGTTISDYRRVDDKQGSFQNFLQVYGKKVCPKEHVLVKLKADGRSTYYCPVCQKEKATR